MTKYCDVCGSRMLHYENPDRDQCPNENSHAKRKSQKRPGNTVQDGRRIIGKKKDK